MNEIDRARDALFHLDSGRARDEWVRVDGRKIRRIGV